jgi:signal transduction histidine kinase
MKRRHGAVHWWIDLPIRYKGLLVVAIPLLAVALTIALRIPFNRQQQETLSLLEQAATMRQTMQALLLDLLELENSARGYVLTADRTYLTPGDSIRESLRGRFDILDANATRHVERKLTLATELVALKDRGAAADSAEVQQRLREGKELMDGIRTALAAQQAELDARVALSTAEFRRVRRLLTPIILVTFFGGFAGALIAAWLFATGIAERVSALERNAERLAGGERLRGEPSRGGDEIGSLDKALRRASLLLRTRQRELQSVNRQLEQTVHEQALLNRELEAFSYSVSHDLRAPLRSIDGFAQALREDWGDRLDETGQDQLSRVRNAAQRMGRLIDDLLKLSKLTRAQLQRMEVDLSSIAREVASDLSERNPTRNVAWHIADDLRAWCDPSLARVVLENLLGNAWKFTSKTAEGAITFRAMPDSQPTMFVVEDNGAGFDMRYADKLFGPFQRLHAEREFPGTGIGLATIQRIVHKHGGSIRAHGEVGQGAAFYFTLEAAHTTAANA